MQCETQPVIAGFEDGSGPGAKEHIKSLEPGKGKKTDSPLESPEAM